MLFFFSLDAVFLLFHLRLIQNRDKQKELYILSSMQADVF